MLQNCLSLLPQVDFVMLSLRLSFLTEAGRDHEWAASPLHLRYSVWPACITCWVPFKLSSGPFNFEPELDPVRSRPPSSAHSRTPVSQQPTMVSATRPARPVPALLAGARRCRRSLSLVAAPPPPALCPERPSPRLQPERQPPPPVIRAARRPRAVAFQPRSPLRAAAAAAAAATRATPGPTHCRGAGRFRPRKSRPAQPALRPRSDPGPGGRPLDASAASAAALVLSASSPARPPAPSLLPLFLLPVPSPPLTSTLPTFFLLGFLPPIPLTLPSLPSLSRSPSARPPP